MVTVFNGLVMIAVMWILFALVRSQNLEDEAAERERNKKFARNKATYKMRCTRRFTPGVCVDEVVSVWTFEFQILNCTERLGCPQSYRTNRFNSYRVCKRRCGALVDIYMNIIANNGGPNDTNLFLRQSEGVQGRREGQDLETTTPEAPEEYIDESLGDESIMLIYGSVASVGDDDDTRPGNDEW